MLHTGSMNSTSEVRVPLLQLIGSVVGVAVMAALFSAGTAQAAPVVARAASTAADGGEPAPECVQYTASWRYTFVSNGCDATHRLTVEYADGSDVPCRAVRPGETVTFPGYGTGGNSVLRVRLCTSP